MLTWLYNKRRMQAFAGKPLPPEHAYLADITGVIHVGANRGSERHLYGHLGLDVLWVEADPKLFKRLDRNIAGYPKQRAVNALVSDADGVEMPFYRAANNGASSSMFPMTGHAEMFPGVEVADELTLQTKTMRSILADQSVALDMYQAAVLDVQGAELHVLKGFGDLLPELTYLKVEASDFEAYGGGNTLDDILEFCTGQGFTEIHRDKWAETEGIGAFYDVIFKRNDPVVAS